MTEHDSASAKVPGANARSPRHPARLLGAEHRLRAFELRIKGWTYQRIGAELGVNTKTAWKLIDKHLKRTSEQTAEIAESIRAIEVARCDALIASLWDRATDPGMATVNVPADNEAGFRPYDGQDKAINGLVKVLERRAKLLGIDAPTKTTLGVGNGDGSGSAVLIIETTPAVRPTGSESA